MIFRLYMSIFFIKLLNIKYGRKYMTVIINYFNNSVKIFDSIISLDGSNNEDYILVDSLNNDIRISRKNVEYILVDKNEIKEENVY